jgi:hypothetical protein
MTFGAACECGRRQRVCKLDKVACPPLLPRPYSPGLRLHIWRIEVEGNNKVLAVDGRQWKEGQTSAGIADKARALYGDRYAEFPDRVQAYAYSPTSC